MNAHVPPDLLSALVDGEVAPDERLAAHAHLAECDACRSTMDSYARVQRAVSGLPRLVAPHAFVSELLAPPGGPLAVLRHALRGPRRYVAAGAAAAVAFVSLGGLASPGDERPPPVDVLVQRHAGASASSAFTGQVIFAVTGR